MAQSDIALRSQTLGQGGGRTRKPLCHTEIYDTIFKA
jgi:hypothetical protein